MKYVDDNKLLICRTSALVLTNVSANIRRGSHPKTEEVIEYIETPTAKTYVQESPYHTLISQLCTKYNKPGLFYFNLHLSVEDGGRQTFHYRGPHWLFISLSRAAEKNINNVVDSKRKCNYLT
jgi:hypothetical protein